MFESTHSFPFLDYFRVPYRISPPVDGESAGGWSWGELRVAGENGPTLAWLVTGASGSRAVITDPALRRGRYHLGSLILYGHVAGDEAARDRLSGSGRDWRRAHDVIDDGGRRVASVWRDARGSVLLPFDPAEVMTEFWSEGYQTIGPATLFRRSRPMLQRLYYACRPLMPRPLQITLRRLFTRLQKKEDFPRWPIEPALHDLYDWLFSLLAGIAGRPVPWLDFWPDGRTWALVLTHDVETELGCRQLHLLRDVERDAGHVSSWNFVPLRYQLPDEIRASLVAEGCEIGVHGLFHDGRDLASLNMLNQRLPAMHEYARRWGAVGFRAPSTQRNWTWMAHLGFSYDSSYHDTAPYEPEPGGSCSLLPYFIGDVVELPITLAQDHTLFAILRQSDAVHWADKLAHIRSRHAMALVLTHPDYAEDAQITNAYRSLLEMVRDDPTVWRALPRDVSAWWRRRAASTVEPSESGWVVRGPAAADGRVVFATSSAYERGALGPAQWRSSPRRRAGERARWSRNPAGRSG